MNLLALVRLQEFLGCLIDVFGPTNICATITASRKAASDLRYSLECLADGNLWRGLENPRLALASLFYSEQDNAVPCLGDTVTLGVNDVVTRSSRVSLYKRMDFVAGIVHVRDDVLEYL